jgi:hypothetical protein
MWRKHTTYFETHLFAKLRQLTGITSTDPREMVSLCNYIDWAMRSGYKLKFQLTEEELMLIEAAIEMVIYNDLGAYPEQTYLPVYELFQAT